MCKPDFFRVDYAINPWMKIGEVDLSLAREQWEKLVNTYRSLGVEVTIIDQDKLYPDMVFVADQGILAPDNKFLVSNFKYKERRGESEKYAKWYSEHGYDVVRLPFENKFEGYGEYQSWRNTGLIGTGFRTSKESAKMLSSLLDQEIIQLELVNEHFYHLDTCLMVLDGNTIIYYPKAFSDRSRKVLESLVPNKIEFDEREVKNFAANSVVISKNVVTQKNNPIMKQLLIELGYVVHEVDLGEFMKSGGGIHCLTGYLA